MPRNLDVYLQQNLVGQLVLDHHGELNFQYADQWLNQPAAMALSHSLPLRPARYNRKMAMKLGGEYDSDKIPPKHFDQLAEEAALARPIVKRRVAELAEAVLANLLSLNIDHPASLAIANLVTGRCRRDLQKFPAAF